MTIYDDYELIANLKGEQGDEGTQGAQGLPGVNAVANDTATAGYISTTGTSETKTALGAVVKTAGVAARSEEIKRADAAYAVGSAATGMPSPAGGPAYSGVPGVEFRASGTSALAPGNVQYYPFEVAAPLRMDNFTLEVTAGPASAAVLNVAIYSADGSGQPLTIIQHREIALGVGATGVITATFSDPKFLQKGNYVAAIATDRAMTLRSYVGGAAYMGTGAVSGALTTYFNAVASYMYPPAKIAPRWTTVGSSATGAFHVVMFQWVRPAASVALDSLYLLPGRQLIKGSNVVLLDQSWATFWQVWDWEGRIKWQIDLAKSIGANTVRIFGNVDGVITGMFTTAQYRAKWRQAIDYCASIGLYVYVCGGDATAHPIADVTAVLVELGKEINGDKNVIGWDVIQENYYFANDNKATVVPALRAVCDRKITFSFTSGVTFAANTSGRFARDQLRDWVDFYDYHAYWDVTPADVDAYWSGGEDKPLVFGEFSSTPGNMTAQVARYETVRASIAYTRTDGRHVAGGLSWAIADQEAVDPAKHYGMWANNGTPRVELIEKFKQFPTVRSTTAIN